MFYVYRFIDKLENVIYVGKSKQDLQQRFKGHQHLPENCYSMVEKIEYIECPTEADMSIKEIYYINKYRNNPISFNLQDVTDLPTTISFDDKWEMYSYALPPHFCNSINVINGYKNHVAIRYNLDGTVNRVKSHKQKGIEAFVEGLTEDEVNLVTNYLINEINISTNDNQEQLCFRNLMMFVISVNLPIKTNDFLDLKYKDFFDEHDQIKSIELQLGRYHQDEIIYIPLRNTVKEILVAYKNKYGLTYTHNANESLFLSRVGHEAIPPKSWGRILKTATNGVGIEKNIGAESPRKTYGLNIYNRSENKLGALLFLGEIWGQVREAKIINYLNLTDKEIDFEYFLGETFSLCDIDLSKIACLNPTRQVMYTNEETRNLKFKQNTQRNQEPQPDIIPRDNWSGYRLLSKNKKIEIIEKNLYKQIPRNVLAEEYGIDSMTITRWVWAYKQYGESAFDDD